MSGFLDEMVRDRAPVPTRRARAHVPDGRERMARTVGVAASGEPPSESGTSDSDGGATSRFGDGRLGDVPPMAGAPVDEWLHDPDRPVPFITADSSAQIGGPDDFAGVETRGDVLVFTSEELDRAAGRDRTCAARRARVDLGADTDIAAKLLDVHPNGFAQRLCDGLVRLRYRAGHERAVPVEPGAVYEVVVEMWDTAQRFRPATGSALEIASSAHPKFAVNLGTGADETLATQGVIARNALYHDAERPSHLVLTVVPAP